MRRYIKKVNCRASAANGQPFSIRTEGDCVNLFLHERNAKHLASRVHVPQFHFTTIASRSQQTTVRAECNCPDPASVPAQLRQFTTCGHLPNSDCAIVGAGSKPPSVSAESNRIETCRMTLKPAQRLSGGSAAHINRPVTRTGSHEITRG